MDPFQLHFLFSLSLSCFIITTDAWLCTIPRKEKQSSIEFTLWEWVQRTILIFFSFIYSMYLNRFVCVRVYYYFFQFAGEIRFKRFSLVIFLRFNCDWVMSKIENFDGLTIYQVQKKPACNIIKSIFR